MANTVWLSRFRDYEFLNIYGIVTTFPIVNDAVRGFELGEKRISNTISDLEKTELAEMNKRLLNLLRKWEQGEGIDTKQMPTKIYLKPNCNLPKQKEVAFRITDGFLILNQTCYEVMSKFNLGKTNFSQVQIYDIKTQEKLFDIPYYFINFSERREFVDAQASKGIVKHPDCDFYQIRSPKTDDIVLTPLAHESDVDLWHDPRLSHSLFLSDNLVQGLLSTGIKKQDLGLVACTIK